MVVVVTLRSGDRDEVCRIETLRVVDAGPALASAGGRRDDVFVFACADTVRARTVPLVEDPIERRGLPFAPPLVREYPSVGLPEPDATSTVRA